MKNFKKLTTEELNEINGGGPIARWVESAWCYLFHDHDEE